jgi:beta-galactosidase/beta-glucuronidase
LLSFNLYAQVSFGKAEKINDEWLFKSGQLADAENYSRWQKLDLPHDWSVRGQLSPALASCTGFLPGGIGHYHKSVNIPESKRGEQVYIYFEGVYNRSEVSVNGKSLGKRPNGYISFMYDATPQIEYGKENVIDVVVDHSQSADSRWYTGSGIYRNVWLVYANPVHIAQWGVYAFPEVKNNKGKLTVEVEIENNTDEDCTLTVVNELFALEDGIDAVSGATAVTSVNASSSVSSKPKSVAKTTGKINLKQKGRSTLKASLAVNNPVLWDLDNPALYTLKTSILKDGKEVDKTFTATGFRTFTFHADKGFALNGKTMKMKGVCLHHDAGALGSAVPREVWKRRMLTLKSIGCNAIRTSHNPQSPDLYDICDEVGMLVMDEAFDEWEFPKRKWLEGWNVGTPGFQGTFDFFEEWGERDLADIVRRDRNHPAIFAWSIGNEVDYPNDPYSHPVLDGKNAGGGFTQPIFGGYKKDAPDAKRLGDIAKRLVKTVKTYDLSRPVTAGLAGVAMSNETEYPGALDIAGYNYTESLYDADHKTYPSRVIYGSENGHGIDAWKAVVERDFIFGQFLWTGIDYLGESGRWPSRGFYSGLLDFGGFIKPRGYFRKSLWYDKPMVYIGTYPAFGQRPPSMDAWPIWNYEPEQSVRVVCYTNTAAAQLFLNGKSVGEKKFYDAKTGIIFWDIPYEEGKLEVVGYDADDKELARYAIQSSKQPYALKIISSDNEIDRNGVAQVVLQVVDENDVPVMIADNEITCRVVGAARLLGLEASNNSDMTDYTDNRQRAFFGRLLAYVKPSGEPDGEIRVIFTSPWLRSVEAKINLK